MHVLRFSVEPLFRSASSPSFSIYQKTDVCLEHFIYKLFFSLSLVFFLQPQAHAQTGTHPGKPDIPPADEIWYHSVTEDSNAEIRILHGDAKLETSDFALSADEIRYNSDTNWAHAQGHVHMEHFASGDKLNAESGDYNIKTQEGRFYGVSGTAPAKVITSPGILTTSNPFYFQALWAERIKDRYVLHDGFLTDCKMPKPWWYFESPVFDVVPGERAIARHAVLRHPRITPLLSTVLLPTAWQESERKRLSYSQYRP